MASQRHNAAFVVGSVLGGLIGAGAALWKAPQTGAELRSKVTGSINAKTSRSSTTTESTESVTVVSSSSGSGASFSSKVLSFVERATAPIVGVKLGRTANGSGPAAGGTVTRIRSDGTTTVNSSGSQAGGSTSPSGGGGHLTSGSSTAPGTATGGSALREPSGVSPSQASTDIPEGVPGHVPTTDELVTPVNPAVANSDTSDQPTHSFTAFPEYKDTKQS